MAARRCFTAACGCRFGQGATSLLFGYWGEAGSRSVIAPSARGRRWRCDQGATRLLFDHWGWHVACQSCPHRDKPGMVGRCGQGAKSLLFDNWGRAFSLPNFRSHGMNPRGPCGQGATSQKSKWRVFIRQPGDEEGNEFTRCLMLRLPRRCSLTTLRDLERTLRPACRCCSQKRRKRETS